MNTQPFPQYPETPQIDKEDARLERIEEDKKEAL